MGTRGRLLLVPTHCLGVLGYQWWPDPRDLLRSWALTKTHSLLVLICRVGGGTCEIYPVALSSSRNFVGLVGVWVHLPMQLCYTSAFIT